MSNSLDTSDSIFHWMTGITPGKRSTFKDVIDNTKNFATLLTIIVALNIFRNDYDLPVFSIWPIGLGFAGLLLFLIFPLISFLLL